MGEYSVIDCFVHDNEINKYNKVKSHLIQRKEVNNEPMFSIIIPTFNRSKYIKYAIDSALAQEINDYEIVIVENGLGPSG